jgi:hypothetical protein
MAVRHVHLSPEAEPILDSVAASFGGEGIALSELPITHESIDSFLDELENSNAEEDCDRSFLDGSERDLRDASRSGQAESGAQHRFALAFNLFGRDSDRRDPAGADAIGISTLSRIRTPGESA